MWWEREEGSWHDRGAFERVFPGAVFGQKQGKFSYRCLVEWHKLGREVFYEQSRGVTDGPVKKVFKEMQELWGDDTKGWPIVGVVKAFAHTPMVRRWC